MGAVTLPLDLLTTGIILVCIWALLLPLLYRVAGVTPEPSKR